MTDDTAEIGIFGGTGIYDSELLQDSKEITIETPYGKTSDTITIGEFEGKRIAFMPRHGKKHSIPPHLINYCANIWAFKELGITRIISPMAVGSLKEEIKPGDFVLPTQFIDFTKSRRNSFSEDGRVIHISVADPFCPDLQEIVSETAGNQSITLHKDCTYACIEGPRFSTKAESKFYKSTGSDIIGMTLVPECQLAREAQMCYVSIFIKTASIFRKYKDVTTILLHSQTEFLHLVIFDAQKNDELLVCFLLSKFGTTIYLKRTV